MAKNIVAKDFVFNSDHTHARLSQRGVASLLKVSQSSVSRFVENDASNLALDWQTLIEQGFDGDALIEVAAHFAGSSRMKSETRKHCTEFIKKTAKIGAQLFIDSLAGVDPTQRRLPCRILDQPTPWEQLYEVEFCDRVFKWFGAQFYWEFAYCFLTPLEICRLNELNPPNKGDRKYRIHQYLEPDTRKRLEPHVLQLIAICNASEDKQQFLTGYHRHFNKNSQLKLNF
jgi:predicted transcriptional regulator